MWRVTANTITMTEGDFGVALPVTISGTTFTNDDTVRISILTGMNGSPIVEKEFTAIDDNTVNLELTQAESALLPVGAYVYRLDWYQSGVFMCNIVPCAAFKVVEKA